MVLRKHWSRGDAGYEGDCKKTYRLKWIGSEARPSSHSAVQFFRPVSVANSSSLSACFGFQFAGFLATIDHVSRVDGAKPLSFRYAGLKRAGTCCSMW